METDRNPLMDPPPPQVPLNKAPLERVLAQIRFPVIASIEEQRFIGPFQEALRNQYPILRREQVRDIVVNTQGLHASGKVAWRFHDAKESWRVSLTPDSLAIETRRYKSRDDFLQKFTEVLAALDEHIQPKVVERLGVRYVDRIRGKSLDDLSTLLKPVVSGILAGPLASQVERSLQDSLFGLTDGAKLYARWGLIPPKTTYDPGVVQVSDKKSWVLDIDVFEQKQREFDVANEIGRARAFAERVYAFFRWAVEDEFLRRYGGKL